MTPIQQMLLATISASKSYVDEVFSPYVYKGTGLSQTIYNGIDLSTEGGMIWAKNRTSGNDWQMVDTVRGDDKYIFSNMNNVQETEAGNGSTVGRVDSFNTNGFTLQPTQYDHTWNNDGDEYASWSFRKAPGFFDVVTYTGNASIRTIDHSLGSVPGCIMIKCLSQNDDWVVYHKDFLDYNYFLRLNTTGASISNAGAFNSTLPTSTNFTLGNYADTNTNGETYVAYVFAGGASTASTARSVDFDGTGDYLTISRNSTTDFNPGSNNYTLEFWINKSSSTNNGYNCVLDTGRIQCFYIANTQKIVFYSMDASDNYVSNMTTPTNSVPKNQWSHVAICRNGSDHKIYINGIQQASATSSTANGDASYDPTIGQNLNQNYIAAQISNLRWVNGTAVYTSSFRPPTEPLTNVTNTKLLCCNNSSTTGSTVTPGTITANGDPTASTDSPFDDSEGFKFGAGGDQNIIKTGVYKGTAGSFEDGPLVNLGWEPEFVLIKSRDTTATWMMLDNVRGVITGENDAVLQPNESDAETTNNDYLEFGSTGFRVISTSGTVNAAQHYIYIAVRRPDGLVGKPVELGTEVFAMDSPDTNTTIPAYTSGFLVDWAFYRPVTITNNWYATARITGTEELKTADTTAAADYADNIWDHSTGWSQNQATAQHSWMFKRHAGFDVVTTEYTLSSGEPMKHNLGQVPEMIWGKNRATSDSWSVYHKDLNGGTTPENYRLKLNSTDAEADYAAAWADTAPTSTVFTPGSNYNGGDKPLFMLFSSVTGVSKVGSYTGNGSATERTITLGFQPRFLIVKNISSNGHDWQVLDTTRGWASGVDQRLFLNTTAAQTNSQDIGQPTSTGFTLTTTNTSWNNNSENYVYYAHA